MTLPILSSVFADGELTNEASWYARIFTAINTIYTTMPRPQQGVQTVTILSGGTSATGTITFPSAFAAAPVVVIGIQTAAVGRFAHKMASISTTSASITVFSSDGAAVGVNSAIVVNWIALAP
jgi:hypothetical protein